MLFQNGRGQDKQARTHYNHLKKEAVTHTCTRQAATSYPRVLSPMLILQRREARLVGKECGQAGY